MRPVFKNGNAVSSLIDGEVDYLIHVTNSKRKMASGIAKEVRSRVPEAYNVYMREQELGKIGQVSVANRVFNMTAQERFGYDGRRYLDYGALAVCLLKVKDDILSIEDTEDVSTIKIGLPHYMGSDRAGGDWGIVMELVCGILGENFQLVVYKLGE